MKIDYIARKVDLTESSRQLAEKKLAKVSKYFNDILDVRLEVELERHLHVVDLSIKGKDFDVQATAQNKDMMAAIQDAVDKIEIQARRAKTRLKDHKKRAGSEAKIDTGWAVRRTCPVPRRSTPRSSGGGRRPTRGPRRVATRWRASARTRSPH